MRLSLRWAALALILASAPLAWGANYTDAAGRQVAVPERIARVFPAGPPAALLVYMVAPEKLLGWTRALAPEEAAFLPAAYGALPELGRLTGRGNTVNLEALLRARPDLVLDLGSVSPTYASLADRVQAQTHIPYVLIGGDLAATAATLRQVGAVLGVPEQAEPLARYAETELAEIRERIASVPAAQRLKVYLARGPRGLSTGVAGSINAEALDVIGVANAVPAGLGAGGLVDVSLEQILIWQPDVIVTMDKNFYASVWLDRAWQGVKAVAAKRVYLAPDLPFGWIDQPPAANRLIGLRWLAKLLYPRLFPEDLRAETSRFYALFYHREPSDPQLDALLGPTR
jgi:iron complex transport system substrate-binding protein